MFRDDEGSAASASAFDVQWALVFAQVDATKQEELARMRVEEILLGDAETTPHVSPEKYAGAAMEALRELIDKHSSAWWMYQLRMLGWQAFKSSTEGEKRNPALWRAHMAESLTAESRRRGTARTERSFGSAFTRETAEELTRLVALTFAWSGAVAETTSAQTERALEGLNQTTEEIELACQLWSDRMDKQDDDNFGARFGTYVSVVELPDLDSEQFAESVPYLTRAEGGEHLGIEYSPQLLSLGDLLALLPGAGSGTAQSEVLAALIVALLSVRGLMPGSVRVLRVGYLTLLRTEFKQAMTATINQLHDNPLFSHVLDGLALPQNGEKCFRLLTSLRTVPGTFDPPALLRLHGRAVILDLVAAGGWLASTADALSLEDNYKDLWQHLETSIQATVDGTGWRPPERIAKLRGVQLVAESGITVTDMDAIAVRDGVMLAINTKGHPLHLDYLRADAREVRKHIARLEKQLSEWVSRVRVLQAAPQGRNYDFRGLELVPVIITPFPPLLPMYLAEQMALPGLRAISTPDELKRFLVEGSQG